MLMVVGVRYMYFKDCVNPRMSKLGGDMFCSTSLIWNHSRYKPMKEAIYSLTEQKHNSELHWQIEAIIRQQLNKTCEHFYATLSG